MRMNFYVNGEQKVVLEIKPSAHRWLEIITRTGAYLVPAWWWDTEASGTIYTGGNYYRLEKDI